MIDRKHSVRVASLLAGIGMMVAGPGVAFANDPGKAKGSDLHTITGTTGSDASIFGHELMSPEELDSHRTERDRATDRDAFDRQHEQRMRQRARDRGVTLSGDGDAKGATGGGSSLERGPGNSMNREGMNERVTPPGDGETVPPGTGTGTGTAPR